MQSSISRVLFPCELVYLLLSLPLSPYQPFPLLVLFFFKAVCKEKTHIGTLWLPLTLIENVYVSLAIIALYYFSDSYFVNMKGVIWRGLIGERVKVAIYKKADGTRGVRPSFEGKSVAVRIQQNRKLRQGKLPLSLYRISTNYISSLPTNLEQIEERPLLGDRLTVVLHGLASSETNMLCLVKDLVNAGAVVCPLFEEKVYPQHIKQGNKDKTQEQILELYRQFRRGQLRSRLQQLTLLLQALLQQGVKSFVLVGHSFGGATIIQFLGKKQPKYIEKVVLLDPWLYPVSREYLHRPFAVQTQMINSETFILSERYSQLLADIRILTSANSGNSLFKACYIRGTDHLFACDFSVILGLSAKTSGIKQEQFSWEWLVSGASCPFEERLSEQNR